MAAIKIAAYEDMMSDKFKRAVETCAGAKHHAEKHRGERPEYEFKQEKRCRGQLDRDCKESAFVRSDPDCTMNQRAEDNGLRL